MNADAIMYEFFDGELIEAIGQTYQRCFFFNCEFSGVRNVYLQCSFRGCGPIVNSYAYGCLFQAGDG